MPRLLTVNVAPVISSCLSRWARARSTRSARALADLAQAHLVDAAQDRDDQPVRERDGDAEVHVAVAGDLALLPLKSALTRGVLAAARRDGLGDEVAERELDLLGFELLVEPLAERGEVFDVDVDRLVEVRDRSAWTAGAPRRWPRASS